MQPNSYPGKFIVFEGLDGSGQTTQVELLFDYFMKHSHKGGWMHTKEPTQGSRTGQAVQEVLAHSTALKWKKQALKNLLKARGPDLVEKKPAAMHCQRTQISEAV